MDSASPANTASRSRTLIEPSGGKFLPKSHAVSAFMTDKYAELQCVHGLTWKHVDAKTKAFYWEEFEKKYYWHSDNDAQVKSTWETLSADLYRKTLCNWRTKPSPPRGVNLDIWDAWKKAWSTPEWQQKSEAAKRNRNSEPAGLGTGVVKHTGGSRSYVEHTIKMHEDLNRHPTYWELFTKLHTQKDGTWIDARSKALNDEMNARLFAASQPATEGGQSETPTSEAINEMYLDAAGGVKKNRIYGMGSQAFVSCHEAMLGKGRGAASTATAARVEELTNDNTALRQELALLREQVKYLMENALFNPESIPNTP